MAKRGSLQEGWPVYRETDRLYLYLSSEPRCTAPCLALPPTAPVCRPPAGCLLRPGRVGAPGLPPVPAACRPSPPSHPPARPPSPAGNPPARGDLAWPAPLKATAEAQRFPQLAAPPPAAQQEAGAEQPPQAATAPAAADGGDVAAEEAALRALLQQAGGVALCSSAAVLGAAGVRLAEQRELAARTACAHAALEDATQEEVERWLRRSTRPGESLAAPLQAVLAAQQRALSAPRPQPLPRLHGGPPPDNVGAAVRHMLLRRQYADQAVRRVLAEVAEELVAERARRAQRGRQGRGRSSSSSRSRSRSRARVRHGHGRSQGGSSSPSRSRSRSHSKDRGRRRGDGHGRHRM